MSEEIIKDSFWLSGYKIEAIYPTLEKDIKTDVAVIGSGITGLTTAYLLAKAGKKVVVLEQDILIKNTTTAYSTGFLSYILDGDFSPLLKQSAIEAIDVLERIIKEEKIDCDFARCPLFVCADSEQSVKKLPKENIGHYPLGNAYNVCAKFEGNAKINSVKFMQGLIKVLDKMGVRFFENTKVLGITDENPVMIETEKANVQAEYAVLAKNSHKGKKYPLSTDVTYVLAADLQKHDLPEGIFIDTYEPYNYFRVDGKKIILGGQDNSSDLSVLADERYKKLENHLIELVGKNNYIITHQWSGQVVNSVDGLPYIGESIDNKHQLLSAGHGGDGLTLGMLSAMINSDIILGRKNKDAALFKPKRLKSACRIIRQGANALKSLYTGRINLKELDIEKIPNDTGAVGTIDKQKVAIYKDEKGDIKKLSPVCSHLGCIVHWNNKAKTWDCPCHGSRFTKDGRAKTSPAKKPLASL
ncbi:MAG: FAD-dependent oxidoreductase [Patescibacteria group bacterium]|jgi:glycine/D-amino acid oxidase-like deaminating enzyme/nitrite reductase/ring-hydroxylating ferredoxin subunit